MKTPVIPTEAITQSITRLHSLIAEVENSARRTVAAMILSGKELAFLKPALGFDAIGRRPKEKVRGETVSDSGLLWGQWCRATFNISKATAWRWIGCYEAAKARAKRRKDTESLALLEADPASFSAEQISLLADCVHRLVEEPDKNMPPTTQWQLLEEIGMVERKPIPPGGGNKADTRDPAELEAEIEVKCLLDEVKDGLKSARTQLHAAAAGKGFLRTLAKLHRVSSDPEQVTLKMMKDQFEGFRDQTIPEITRDLEAAARNVENIVKTAAELIEQNMQPVAVKRPSKTPDTTKR